MKTLNNPSTRIFCKLLDKLGEEIYMKLEAEGFMPLVMEKVGGSIGTPFGAGQLYSLAHYYTQNGDAMRDPEMCFIVSDNRVATENENMIRITPQFYQQDSLGLYEESVTIENDKVTTYKPVWHKGHLQFANEWLKNIRAQGFLVFKKQPKKH